MQLSKHQLNALIAYIRKFNLLDNIVQYIKNRFNLTIYLGVELEFYIQNTKDDIALINQLEAHINNKIEVEQGNNQFEIKLKASNNISKYANYICYIRNSIIYFCNQLGTKVYFNAKPYPEDYGNSMQVSLSFLEEDHYEKYANMLCYYLPDTINMFFMNDEDYKRLDSKYMAPTHISHGNNNRTTMIRFPDSYPKRLEHRLASADASPHLILYAILNSIYNGLHNINHIPNFKKIYGNAHDPQYGLTKICNLHGLQQSKPIKFGENTVYDVKNYNLYL
ncbi:type I glutamate--ammonia ligase [Rickettsia endosymbiont of Cardiosporidium cionae]|uniref:glutamine synthetase n=1 Tax=Rickettsia endosymbiont of Cardiosporidium cionae TaxID=2777155 RepID=UPI001895554F|nr:glutamine synthetase [Rickettsia endosymbiont of Cardiosporidium cionae]KAF8818261.1 glutamine synthetase [Rickettsia endosymbiont of Cardiosporidium cionae]